LRQKTLKTQFFYPQLLYFAIFGIPLMSKKKKEKETAKGNLRKAKNSLT
jgi:hypothetical protein